MYHAVKEAFNAAADRYDAKRRGFIPCFDDFYQTAVEQIPFESRDEFQVLDLGAGTGLFSALVRAVYPRARLALIDFAEEMLNRARERFAGDALVSFIAGDYSAGELPGGPEVIMSALSIHHLEDADKRLLFRRIFAALKPGGIFINADLVLGSTPRCEAHCQAVWVAKMKALGVSDEDFAGWSARGAEDRLAPLEPQLAWLREAGFEDVECFYRYYNFAVFAGRRPLGGR